MLFRKKCNCRTSHQGSLVPAKKKSSLLLRTVFAVACIASTVCYWFLNAKKEDMAESTLGGDVSEPLTPDYSRKNTAEEDNQQSGEIILQHPKQEETPKEDIPVMQSEETVMQPETVTYYANSATKKFHKPTCMAVDKIGENEKVTFDSIEAATAAGYVPCKRCNPTT